MSKTPARNNTLFKYFSKSPASSAKPGVKDDIKTPPGNKRILDDSGNSDTIDDRHGVSVEKQSDETQIIKRRRLINTITESVKNEKENTRGHENITTSKNVPKAKVEVEKKPAREQSEVNSGKIEEIDDGPTVWQHLSFEFLLPDKIKDASGRRPNHPDYDTRTLYVPESFLKQQSPAMRQWWLLKAEYFDCILFFKVGKFYELYHMDAVVSVQELQLIYMRGNFAHTGMPESSYHKMSSTLIEKGYKVARIEQTETPDMMEERRKELRQTSKFDKVVKREVCQITHRGTQVFGQQCALPQDNCDPHYLISICEKTDVDIGCHRFGVCVVETSLGKIIFGEFDDNDSQCSRLLTLFAQYQPTLLLYDKKNSSVEVATIMRTILAHVPKENLSKNSQMWSAEKTLQVLVEKYFKDCVEMPISIKAMQDPDDHLGLKANADSTFALRALGGVIWYLQRSLLDHQVLPASQYEIYAPPDGEPLKPVADFKANHRQTHLVLDATTISNLHLFGNHFSLYNTINHCSTSFGKRLLYQWICTPSCNATVIRQRQDAISELMEQTNTFQELRRLMSTLPDMERLLAQIQVYGIHGKDRKHPDSRAILFEAAQYGKKKVRDFSMLLEGFQKIFTIPTIMGDHISSTLLRFLSQFKPNGSLTDLRESVSVSLAAFDQNVALKSGVIEPKPGQCAELDELEREMLGLEDELKEYVADQEAIFKCKIGIGINRNRCQLEIPEENANKGGHEYFLESQFKSGTKKMKRYHTAETKRILKRMLVNDDKKKAFLLDYSRIIFAKFAEHADQFKQCVANVANLDVLIGLAEYARNLDTSCQPEFIIESNDEEMPILELEDGFHPCLLTSGEFIPNGMLMGDHDGIKSRPTVILLTGPNMGGKSTLMRQIGLHIIMAHMGLHVPAKRFRLSLCDRVFTRLGAKDDLSAGQSTFFMELNEASTILKHATRRSFVLIDELGRGTGTFDGTAIAVAVLNNLMDINCRTIFSTHYHNLVEKVKDDRRILLGHMACMVENENSEDPTEEDVTFLYKYAGGACPKSYGFNAAKIAGIPSNIIRRGFEIAKNLERKRQKKLILRAILDEKYSVNDIAELFGKL